MTSDLDYYRGRANDERKRAAAASGPDIANIHLELAAKYDALASEAKTQPGSQPDWDDLPGAQTA